MAVYAILDENSVVISVTVGKDPGESGHGQAYWEDYYRGKLTDPNGGVRKNYAGIGYSYDLELDAFVPPKPHPSWVLDHNTAQWTAPVPYPNDGGMYVWNEAIIDWSATSRNN